MYFDTKKVEMGHFLDRVWNEFKVLFFIIELSDGQY